ncbi:MAG: glycerol-3-phosphate 1-O-acyltransferase PlsY [Wenzhouxiangellaceae bacterium]|nr:glycerol-3-phosphate 1-O-acyltransferase PlsY [Wenzhouxiangellaceae bacterium]
MDEGLLPVVSVALLGYLLGSLSGSLLLGRWRGLDVRTAGSGNAGGTNALRVAGWRFALAVIVIDIGKGVAAVLLAPLLADIVFGLEAAVPPASTTLAAIAGLAAVLGHVWPLYFGFRGGKGAGTAVGVVAVLAPGCMLPLLLVWLITLIGTGYVGLATVLAGLALVPAMWWVGPDPLPVALTAWALAIALLIVYTHRGNLARLRSGTENRFERARLLKRR